MKITNKIDWWGVGYLTNLMILIISTLLDLNNIISCYETYGYQVNICNYNICFFISMITLIIWIISTGYIIISLVCIKWDIKENKQKHLKGDDEE